MATPIPYGWNTKDEIIYRFLLIWPVLVCIAMMLNDIFSTVIIILLTIGNTLTVICGMFFVMYKPSTVVNDKTGYHIVLTSNYREQKWMLDRLISSVKNSQTTWPVFIVVAAERNSNLVNEKWSFPEADHIYIAIHEKGLPGERAGLGSNLHNAINYINKNLPIQADKAIVTKIDGNCFINKNHFELLESQWRVGDSNIVYQLLLEEVDPDTEEYSKLPWLLKYGWTGFITRWSTMVSTVVPGGIGLMSCFCIPLQLINDMGNWCPWVIQEDNYTWYRAIAGSSGFPKMKIIQSVVFNAPTLTYYDTYKQIERSWVQAKLALSKLWGHVFSMQPMKWVYVLTSAYVHVMYYGSFYVGIFMIKTILIGIENDFRVTLLLVTCSIVQSLVSASHSLYVHHPKTFIQRLLVFFSFIFANFIGQMIFTCILITIYVKSWFTRDKYVKYHTTAVVSR
jgi:hypothetical protein